MERDEIRIKATGLRNGVTYRMCPKCKVEKPLDDFGLRKMGVKGKHGGDVITNQSHCRACRD
jgi:hypothetical protein